VLVTTTGRIFDQLTAASKSNPFLNLLSNCNMEQMFHGFLLF
jgi:hypothetical protein